MDPVKHALETGRLELLDMGLRGNSLLNFRPGAKTLEVIDERSDAILRLLVQEKRALNFIPLPPSLLPKESIAPTVAHPLPEAPDATAPQTGDLVERLAVLHGDERHQDSRLQTQLAADALDLRLLKIFTEANTYYQEQGIHILYLALGFLGWYESGNTATERRAPLLLVPVSLHRSSARERFSLRYTEADLGPNLALAAKLKAEFHLELPGFDEDVEPLAYCAAVRAAVAGQARWRVAENDVALGFFSFGKFQMYQDLAEENWPPQRAPHLHPTLQCLLGKGFTKDPTAAVVPVLTELNCVKDADFSQTEAMLAVRSGGHLVIQGPPGTGKSQTITNIIADALASGKTVLFVAEKMAALEVVKRRLDDCGLGAAALELHSHKSNKRAVLEELSRTLDLRPPALQDAGPILRRHRQLQQQLDDYCAAVNTAISNSGYSFVEALGLRDETLPAGMPPLNCGDHLHWDAQRFERAETTIKALAEHLQSLGVPSQTPFADAALTDFSPLAQQVLSETLTRLAPLLEACRNQNEALAAAAGTPVPQTAAASRKLQQALAVIAEHPDLTGLQVRSSRWHTHAELLRDLLQKKIEMTTLVQRRQQQVTEHAWQADLQLTREIWANLAARWWRVLAADFRRAQRTLQTLCRGPVPEHPQDALVLLDDLLRHQSLARECRQHAALIDELFGERWERPAGLLQAMDWLRAIHGRVAKGEVPDAVFDWIANTGRRVEPRLINDLENTLAALEPALARLQEQLVLRPSALERPLPLLQQDCQRWPQQWAALYATAQYNRLRENMTDAGLADLAAMAHEGQVPAAQLLAYFRHVWFSALLNHAYSEREAIRRFDRQQHEQAAAEFRQVDAQLLQHTRERLLIQHCQQLPTGEAGEMVVLRREINKKRRHLPIRQLLAQAGRAVQKIKPVFMMSPMSIATYLQPGGLEFDLVIFDEASQVKVADAFGALSRGRQVVVVGDTRQMPPTDFFSKSFELDDEEAAASQTADIESILNMFLARGARETWLRWHYRSRHESLIQVANREFYDNKLLIFPSPGSNPRAQGLQLQYLPDAVYDRGGSRTNPAEARAVAEAVMEHARRQPDLTLGVVAFSTAQRDCILLELEKLRRADPASEAYFTAGDTEAFFVKNLENVQGDERDIILISIGYGRTAEGTLSRNFGPLNNAGGERRLNVLITRARLAMRVFCNFTAEDLEAGPATPRGVAALRNFLEFAARRSLTDLPATPPPALNPFAQRVYQLLQQRGYQVTAQLGAAGCFLDLALRDPQDPRRFPLAIETDGTNYAGNGAAAGSVRDRDRLRHQVLAGLGWRCYRLWSTDWLRYPEREAERLLQAVETALAERATAVEASAASAASAASTPDGGQT